MLSGRAKPDLSARFADRFQLEKSSGFYRAVQGLEISSLGLGSYLGDLDPATDDGYAGSTVTAVRGGINFIDTSLNYRNQRSEISLGRGLHELTSGGELQRGEFAICTKAGYLVPEAVPAVNPNDVAGRMHCMTADFLSDQMERSRRNLGLETIDVFYLHNPETQLKFLAREEFDRRIRAAFEVLEERVREGKICFYGAATWDGFRKPAGHSEGLSLTRMAEIAKAVGGDGHHFRFIQLPVNLSMGEAMSIRNESVDGQPVTVLDAAEHLGISVVASASLLQARLSRNLPDEVAQAFPGLQTDAQRALQFSRSVPGVSVALVGMSKTAHVKENLTVARVPSLTRQNFLRIFEEE